METLATLIAVAMWCGQPIVMVNSYDPNTIHFYTTKQVDKCRQELLQCLKHHPHSEACFIQEKLDK